MNNKKSISRKLSGQLLLLFTTLLLSSSFKNFEADRNFNNASPLSTGLENQYILLDDINLRYQVAGEGEPILLLHHVRGQIEYFNKIIPSLAERYKVIAVDLPGHGLSDMPTEIADLDYYTRKVKEFIIKMDLQDLTIMGESIGGSLTLALANDSSLNIKNIIALNSFDGERGLNTNFFGKLYTNLLRSKFPGKKMTTITNKKVIKTLLKGGFYNNKNLSNELVDLYYETSKREGLGENFRNFIIHRATFKDITDSFKKISIPTLIIHSEDDWSGEEFRSKEKDEISNAEFVTLEKTGHFSCQESPEAVLQKVHSFLESKS